MTKTNKDCVERFRKKQKAKGLVELRSIYVKRSQNTKEVKAMVADFISGMDD